MDAGGFEVQGQAVAAHTFNLRRQKQFEASLVYRDKHSRTVRATQKKFVSKKK